MPALLDYDEFAFFHENAEEFGLPWNGQPVVSRLNVQLTDGRHLSMLRWGTGQPTRLLLHGGGQNAHTWDTVCLALGGACNLIAIDLPGHGHSGEAPQGPANPAANAPDIAEVIATTAPAGLHLVGMSLGGLTSLAVADRFPNLVKSILLVDVTPGVTVDKSRSIIDFVSGPASFPDLETLVARAVQFNPGRSVSSLRRGILHNAKQLPDGSWIWRYARLQSSTGGQMDYSDLWPAVSRLQVPLCLARGLQPQSVVTDEDEAELLARRPGARIEHFPDAGHSIQGATPLKLADLIRDFGGE